MTTSLSPKYLPVIIAVLTLGSLVGAIVLECLNKDASQAWTAFLAFAASLLAVHIPAPSQTTVTPVVTTTASIPPGGSG